MYHSLPRRGEGRIYGDVYTYTLPPLLERLGRRTHTTPSSSTHVRDPKPNDVVRTQPSMIRFENFDMKPVSELLTPVVQ